ncbi:MAG: type II toxin-antitoxin system prevent-host-death family antitoxin [Gammaproteobacteria bacterium]|nr:type II toxin-antitoxin system prevent-host-death family antitoxin [Gammaproteobacteria bacterium]
MKTVSYTALRGNLARALDQVNEDREPVVITRRKGAPAVLLALAEYESLEETAYLLRNPANAAHLRRGLAQVEARKTRRRKLLK